MSTIREKLAASGRAWDVIVAAVEAAGVTVGDVHVSANDHGTSVILGGSHDGTVGFDWKDANALVAAFPESPLGWSKTDQYVTESTAVRYETWRGAVAGVDVALRVVARALTVVGGAQ